MEKQLKIAVTGGIGSGKSQATSILKNAGYTVFSCDEENASLLKKRSVLKRIKKEFPFAVKGFLRLSLDKKALSEKVFSDAKSRKILTDIMHPLIMKKIFEKAKSTGDVSFIEVPLLFESGLSDRFDGTIVICADKEKRIERVKARSSMTENEIEKRISAQFNYDMIDKNAYCVIDNNGDLSELKEKVLTEAKKLIEKLYS